MKRRKLGIWDLPTFMLPCVILTMAFANAWYLHWWRF